MDTIAEQSVGGTIVTPNRKRRRYGHIVLWLMVIPVALWAVTRVTGLETGSFGTSIMTATPFVAAASLLPLVLAAFLRARAALAVAVASTIMLGFSVLPRAFGSPDPAVGRPLRILTTNMLFGRADVDHLMDLVRRLRPDVLSAQELTPGMVERLEEAGLSELLPYNVLEPGAGASGTGLYGRYPMKALPDLFTRIGHHMPAASMELPGGPPVEIVAVHTYTPLGRQVTAWKRGLAALPPSSPDVVRILAGDFNASLDHAALRAVLSRGYVSAADQVGVGLVPTWPAGGSRGAFITIDHVLVPERVNVLGVNVHDIPDTDHRAIFTDLRVP
ncbi:endonuclease/exonuclease/phosphatase family protein [Sinosporangium siamense]|uniref:endonuclease/exonuclease/phosphatase family protein n=1 Tax=Sinosporangium siamense TaxID=1367973 RepID=UPI001EF23585|nr:endonuclease/exonuclease/phosphatase family protein [Sinosporangium siamense]